MTAAGHPGKFDVKRRVRSPFHSWGAALALALAAALAAGANSSPRAATTERVVADRHTGLALYGVDPVAYFARAKPTVGREDFEYRYAGAIWRFENEGNRAAFIKDPAVYMPRYGGHDPLGIARGVATPGFPELWSVVEDRLYLFYGAEARKAFLADPHSAIAAADARWPAVMKDLPE